MKRMITCLTALAMLLAAAPAMAADKPTIYVAGDSTGQTYKQSDRFPQFGWGQVFGDIFTNDVVVINLISEPLAQILGKFIAAGAI